MPRRRNPKTSLSNFQGKSYLNQSPPLPYYEVDDDFPPPPPPPISDDGVAREAWEEPAVPEFRFHESTDLVTVKSLITKKQKQPQLQSEKWQI